MQSFCKSLVIVSLACFSRLVFPQVVDTPTLLHNLSHGQIIELNQYSPGEEKGLLLRLVATPDRDEVCGLETGTVCKNKHVLTVATFDELPEVQAFALNAKGEFLKAEWANSASATPGPDSAQLVLIFRQYHRFATRANPSLPRGIIRVNVKVSPSQIQESSTANF